MSAFECVIEGNLEGLWNVAYIEKDFFLRDLLHYLHFLFLIPPLLIILCFVYVRISA